MARKCILCGKEYTYCPSCPKDAKKESWYAIFDNENCKNISKTLTDYNLNKISKVEARHALLACDLSIKLNDHYRNEINEIIERPKRGKRSEIKGIIDEAIVEPEVLQLIVEKSHVVVEKENE
jgi:hypothetical protein